ncbi:MAG: zinc-dependent alcohol dehydrogenase family protein [Gammaproteobacteria bacterium]|nr:zinc-dependent alcohol dehydrogenase family protein [Gammaproteobacteria bacterium]
MKAMLLRKIGPVRENVAALEYADVAVPVPQREEILIEVSACGVCHTELDEIEGRTPPPSLPVIPGHEVVGRVVQAGEGAGKHALGARVGVGWIFHSTGDVNENLSPDFVATGRDVNGGYAQYMKVHQDYAYPIPAAFDDTQAAPLLCAGGVGFRSLRLAGLHNGQALGLTGFGGSGHLVLQLARHQYPDSPVFVFARSAEEQRFARQLGADWSGDTEAEPPSLCQAVIDTTPAWRPVLAALRMLEPGGRLVINAIRKEDRDKALMSTIDYGDHLWREKEIKSVANVTADDIREFLALAAQAGIEPEVETYALQEANRALWELKERHVRGAKVLLMDHPG